MVLALSFLALGAGNGQQRVAQAQPAAHRGLPTPAEGWSIELLAQAPLILYPTAIVAAPDGSIYLGSDPMDMPGPATMPIDRVLVLKDGRVTVFAERLWSVMGLEWSEGTLYVVHAPFLSAFRDTDGDGKADARVDLVTGLGPKLPGASGINDHVASGIRLGMDGFLYISVGDKGIPRAAGRDGKSIQLHGGGVIRVRPDGTGLEVVSTGECNPVSVALSATDEIFTYGNDDDSKQWPNSLTHHIVTAHFGYPYQFQTAPHRALPVMAGQLGGAGAQGICYNDDLLPEAYRGNLFFCDWGLQSVLRFEIRKSGGTFALVRRTVLVTKGDVSDFRPFSLAVSGDGASLLLVDWGYNGWLAGSQQTGRVYRLRYTGKNNVASTPRLATDRLSDRIQGLDHPALSIRIQSQHALAREGSAALPPLVARLRDREPEVGRLHALWALDAISGPEARMAITSVLHDASPRVRLQAARSVGIRCDQSAKIGLIPLLRDRDPAVRREAAIALGRLKDPSSAPALYAALDEADAFASWSIRQAIRRLEAWEKDALVAALLDDRRRESALRLADEAWALPVIAALTESFQRTESAPVRARIVAVLAGLYRQYPAWSGLWFGTNPLAGPVPQKTKDWSQEGMKAVLAGLALALKDPDRAVRYQAIFGASQAGLAALPRFRAALARELDPDNQAVLAETLGTLGDKASIPLFSLLLRDPRRSEAVRLAALDALARFGAPMSLRARLALIYDEQTPPALVARALPGLARAGLLPPNDVASFLGSASPAVRAAAILSLNVKRGLPPDLEQAVLDRFVDEASEVRAAAMLAVVPLHLRAAIPRLLSITGEKRSPDRARAIAALCGLADKRALRAYLDAISDPDPALRRSGERALLAIRDQVAGELASAARSGELSGPAALSLDRVLARFEPVSAWRVIGPFPRAAPPLFLGASSIDWTKRETGAGGRTIAWSPRRTDAATGRVDLSDFQRAPGDPVGLGYDPAASPDLGAFAYAEIESRSVRPALLLLGSSGTMFVTVNEKLVYQFTDLAGRPYNTDSDSVRVQLAEGRNRILVLSRQGIGAWCFAVQVGRLEPRMDASPSSPSRLDALRDFALRHAGDPARGEQLFFDPHGVGCVQCHSANGHGTATIGPDLTALASKYDRAEIIRSVLEPSNRIASGYQPVVVATRSGRVLSGVVRAETDERIDLVDAQAQITRIPKKDIELRRSAAVSIMPAQSVLALAPEEFADLISYVCSLRAVTRP
jgi:putative membrane-bound dehydrogenase-like protein